MSNIPPQAQYNTAESKPQYHLIWDAIDEKGMVHQNVHESYSNRDDAIAAYNGLKASGAANIRGFCDANKCITVDVEFTSGGRQYTYLHNELAVPNQLAVVRTSSGLVVVKVVKCVIRTKQELSKKLPLDNYKHLVGLVK